MAQSKQTPARRPASAAAVPRVDVAPRLTAEEAAGLAATAGLRQAGVRPPLWSYARSVWNRRSFIWNLASSKAYAKNQGSYLGQAWNVIRPLLDAGIYIIVFGFMLRTRAGIENVIAFITVGTFAYSLMQRMIMSGTSSILNNLALVRSHRFPRAVVPLSEVLADVVLFVPAMAVMAIIAFAAGAPLAWTWLLLPVVAVVVAVFGAGVGLLFARLGARTPDIQNVIPFFLSLGRWGSGVMFNPMQFVDANGPWAPLVQYNPFTVFINLFRACIGNEPSAQFSTGLWLLGIGYAIAALTIGFIAFWGAEETYGRD